MTAATTTTLSALSRRRRPSNPNRRLTAAGTLYHVILRGMAECKFAEGINDYGRANGTMWRLWQTTEVSAKGCDRWRKISQLGISLRYFNVILAWCRLFDVLFYCLSRKIGQIWYNGDTKAHAIHKEGLCKRSLSRRPLHTHLVAWQLCPFTNALLIAQSFKFAFNYTLPVTETGAHVEIKRQS